jgi:hypothetical protein
MCLDMVPDYVKAVTTSAELETILCMEDGGLASNVLWAAPEVDGLETQAFRTHCSKAGGAKLRGCRVTATEPG